jgi:GT2 family glycosyltransferase
MLTRTVGRFQLDDDAGAPPLDVDFVIGNACMMRRATLEEVGFFDEEFWQCNEDADWCYRARRAGWRVVYVDRAAILHKGGSSADISYGKIFSYGYFIGRNAFMFARKYGLRLTVAMLIGVAGRLTIFFGHNVLDAFRKERAFVRGVLDGLRGRLDPEQIEVHFPVPHWDLHPGPVQRLRRWLGA